MIVQTVSTLIHGNILDIDDINTCGVDTLHTIPDAEYWSLAYHVGVRRTRVLTPAVVEDMPTHIALRIFRAPTATQTLVVTAPRLALIGRIDVLVTATLIRTRRVAYCQANTTLFTLAVYITGVLL